jgi:hypothetical protein
MRRLLTAAIALAVLGAVLDLATGDYAHIVLYLIALVLLPLGYRLLPRKDR